MVFKFIAGIFKNDPSQNKNNNPNFPTHGGLLKLPISQLKEFVEYLHYAARTELEHDSYLNEQFIPVKLSGWAREKNGKRYLSLSFEPHYQTNLAAQQAKEASQSATPEPTVQEAAANLAQGTAGTVVDQAAQEDIF